MGRSRGNHFWDNNFSFWKFDLWGIKIPMPLVKRYAKYIQLSRVHLMNMLYIGSNGWFWNYYTFERDEQILVITPHKDSKNLLIRTLKDYINHLTQILSSTLSHCSWQHFNIMEKRADYSSVGNVVLIHARVSARKRLGPHIFEL